MRWKVPGILFAVPGIAAGLFVPALLVRTPVAAPSHTVGMTFTDFSDDMDSAEDTVVLHTGDRITFANSSRNIHAIGPGQNGQVTSPVPGEPLTGYRMMETNDRFTTEPWTVPGTYYVTCSIHPMMNLTIVVRP